MLKFKIGCAISATLEMKDCLLLNCVNCQGKYASGIAKTIRQKIPQAYEDYLSLFKNYENKRNSMLGKYIIGKKVIHLASQEYYGYYGERYVNYGALASAFQGVVNEIGVRCSGITIVIPYGMCAGLAGGDWDIVLELIEYLVVPYFKDVIVYKLEG